MESTRITGKAKGASDKGTRWQPAILWLQKEWNWVNMVHHLIKLGFEIPHLTLILNTY